MTKASSFTSVLVLIWLISIGSYRFITRNAEVHRSGQSSVDYSSRSSGKILRQYAKGLGSKGSPEVFICELCGTEHVKWAGRCNSCKEWNTIKSFRVGRATSYMPPLDSRAPDSPLKNRWIAADVITNSTLQSMASIKTEDSKERMVLSSGEVNRVLGGGVVKGSVILLAGEPGVGKSTLLLQLASDIAGKYSNVVYVSGEENQYQIAMRGKRLHLNTDNIFLICDVEMDRVLDMLSTFQNAPSLVIVDSIQTMRVMDCQSSIGSVSQIRDTAARLVQYAKSTSTSIVLVGHVTKSGDVAGPRVLEHMVDAVLYLEGSERTDHRILKTVKNRFGSAAEVGVLAMNEEGMKDVSNPSELFMSRSVLNEAQEGSAVMISLEGSRAMLAEVQCLVSYSYANGKSLARRASDGFPLQRLLLICAVIEKRLRLSLGSRDVYLNVVGGLRISEPTADLAVAVAAVSSLTSVPIHPATAFIGELGLGGELRGGKRMEQRIQEAAKLGFKRIVLPATVGKMNMQASGVQLIPCHNLQQAIQHGLMTHDVNEIVKGVRSKQRKSSTSTNSRSGGRSVYSNGREEVGEMEEDLNEIEEQSYLE